MELPGPEKNCLPYCLKARHAKLKQNKTEIDCNAFKRFPAHMRKKGGLHRRVRRLAFVVTVRTANRIPASARQRPGSARTETTGSRIAIEGRETGEPTAQSS